MPFPNASCMQTISLDTEESQLPCFLLWLPGLVNHRTSRTLPAGCIPGAGRSNESVPAAVTSPLTAARGHRWAHPDWSHQSGILRVRNTMSTEAPSPAHNKYHANLVNVHSGCFTSGKFQESSGPDVMPLWTAEHRALAQEVKEVKLV